MKTNNSNCTTDTLFFMQKYRIKLVSEGIMVGLISGLLVVFYRLALDKAGLLAKSIYKAQTENIWLIPIWIIVLIVGGYIVGNMIKKNPMISGSGIPQVEGILMGHLNMNWWRVIVEKFVGGVICITAGLSLGREGPSIQLGAAVGQGFSRIFKRIKIEEKYLITSGASAGLAAAFNAPLAGVIFALEEVHKNFSPLVLISTMSASLVADFVSKEFFGLKPIFQFESFSVLPLKYYAFIIIFGIIIGMFGVFYNYTLLKTQNLYANQKWLPVQFRPIIPFVLAGMLGLFLPEVLGGGHELIVSIINGNNTLRFLFILLLIKFAFSMVSFGSGAPGGIFFPLLVIGGMTGAIYGTILVKLVHFPPQYVNNFMILGMAGYFTAIVRAPITGSILITEMTGSFNHLLSLALVSIIAYIIADLMGSKPIYESLLERILAKNGHKELSEDNNAKTILEVVVHHGSYLEGKKIKELNMPEKCLLVSIKRGDNEVIPRGNTSIYAGDYLVVLTSEHSEISIRENLLKMAESSYAINNA